MFCSQCSQIIKNISLFSHKGLAFAIGKDCLRVHACIHAHKCFHMHSRQNKYLSLSKLQYSERQLNISICLILFKYFIIQSDIKKNKTKNPTTQLQNNQKLPSDLFVYSCSGTHFCAFPIVSWPEHGARLNSGLVCEVMSYTGKSRAISMFVEREQLKVAVVLGTQRWSQKVARACSVPQSTTAKQKNPSKVVKLLQQETVLLDLQAGSTGRVPGKGNQLDPGHRQLSCRAPEALREVVDQVYLHWGPLQLH